MACSKVIKPFKLRSLFMSEILYVESFQFLLQKFGNWLENFGFGFMNDDYNGPRRQLLKLIMKYCKNIRYFESDDLEIFLRNSQNTFIKKLLIRYMVWNEDSENAMSGFRDIYRQDNVMSGKDVIRANVHSGLSCREIVVGRRLRRENGCRESVW
ncbi:hypothetical protein RhiirA1_398158 [Rhizophagus irregularis]|uniref:Uncharacterized protein n=1 Tax=Rhizophagus irregularis TaxID=588596 RepID=A0A2N0REN4_9GLOM|nr:hypothetical protein RhiirA1_398158 [Rhizophagus irregularis]